jgi:hypothetical protein
MGFEPDQAQTNDAPKDQPKPQCIRPIAPARTLRRGHRIAQVTASTARRQDAAI